MMSQLSQFYSTSWNFITLLNKYTWFSGPMINFEFVPRSCLQRPFRCRFSATSWIGQFGYSVHMSFQGVCNYSSDIGLEGRSGS
jgi:hypothetical protein